ncbi:helix-turn-helix domain-containing protein [Salinisphaera sp.]|uniref:helix-turn-helix domain-containing protein n=1 Tax=Salinisphaera sp. TaxID=1914330 RepID=UPI002D780EA4|nr:helix-turn-helix domain-containing protein [Salinisphaera sp.]HET7313671.1 helix-turn-helix domain-containing protein [Salinisphaera sp.]
MSDTFESIKTGLEQAIAHSKGKPSQVVIHEMSAMDVKSVRDKVGMTQREFATSFGISLGTLRHWERGDRQPHGPARVLLNVLARQPEAVLSALSDKEPIASTRGSRPEPI